MAIKRFEKIINNITEHFSTTWVLLSDTNIFLTNHTKIFDQYESRLRELRSKLSSNRNDIETINEVRQDVALIRKTLRLQGYNLKLGSIDLKIEGFRNDDAMARGFQRCVLFLMNDGDVIYIKGFNNHIDLERALESRMRTQGYRPVAIKHFLWFKWVNRVLILSGAATETAENLELFKEYVSQNKNHLLKKLRKI